MLRENITPRADCAGKLEAQGLSFHVRDDYWTEDACYRFDLREVAVLEAATNELHEMCVAALARAITDERLEQLAIPQAFWDPIAASLRDGDFSLYGRFDLWYDGHGAPKLLEYNADTPTSLLESAVCQWFWLQDQFPAADQFNSIHEKLIARWRELPATGAVHIASLEDDEEDWACATYLVDTLTQAGRVAAQLSIESVGWDAARSRFVDLAGDPIHTLFKLYPWEWLMREEFGAHIVASGTRFIEPLWKAALSCKGLLPLLWEFFPGHPNLLPAYFDAGQLNCYAAKPLYSREGANVQLFSEGQRTEGVDGPYGYQGHIYQALQTLPVFDGHYAVLGSWVVGGKSAGICVREDRRPITTNMSHFVPHYVVN
jgi:glutathionylspermidine synthase